MWYRERVSTSETAKCFAIWAEALPYSGYQLDNLQKNFKINFFFSSYVSSFLMHASTKWKADQVLSNADIIVASSWFLFVPFLGSGWYFSLTIFSFLPPSLSLPPTIDSPTHQKQLVALLMASFLYRTRNYGKRFDFVLEPNLASRACLFILIVSSQMEMETN